MNINDVHNYHDVLAWLKFLDRSLPISEWRADGVDVWPLIRSILGAALHEQIRVTGSESPIDRSAPPHIAELAAVQALTRKHRTSAWRGSAASEVFLRKTEAAHELPLSQSHYQLLDANRLPERLFPENQQVRRWRPDHRWLCFSNGNLDQDLGGKVVNRLFSPIAKQAEWWGVEVREVVTSIVPADYSSQRPGVFGMADSLWWLRQLSRRKPAEIEMPGLDALTQEIEGSPLRAHLAEGALETAARLTATYAKAFTVMLRKEAVTAVFVAPYHSQVGMALCAAARAVGIPAIDIQHGIIGAPNPHYEIDTDVAFNSVPTHLWLWSADEVETPRVGKGCRSFVGGNPAYALAEEARRDHPEWRIETGQYAKEILVTLARGLIPDILTELIDASPPDWRWWIRLHPSDYLAGVREHSAIQPLLDRPNCEWRRASELPLPVLLEIADVHFTKSSSTVIEARAQGVPTVFYDIDGYEYYRYLRNSDRDVYASTGSEAAKAIAGLPPRRTRKSGALRRHFRRVRRTVRFAAVLPWRWAERMLKHVGQDT